MAMPTWVSSWSIVIREAQRRPNSGYWIIRGDTAERVDPVNDGIRVEATADNDR
jgi:hypothetical protein